MMSAVDPHPVQHRFALLNRPPPFRGRKDGLSDKLAYCNVIVAGSAKYPPPERGRKLLPRKRVEQVGVNA